MYKSVIFDFYNVLYDPTTRAINPSMIKHLESLYNKKIALYLFTNSRICFLEEKDMKYDFLKYFNEVVCCWDDRKPSEESFRRLKESVGDEYSHMIMIDDSESVLKFAEELGIKTILYSKPEDLDSIGV